MSKEYYDTNHLYVLDGIRALAIIIIVWFHFWQQSWIMPIIGNVSFDFIPRYGFLLVDMMILISGFCLFIPYAKYMVYKEKIPSIKEFYIKRIARIFPSYYFALIIFFIFFIIEGGVINNFFIKDTIFHLLFVHNWFFDTLLFSNYNGVLWTIAIEIQFYLIFPFIARIFVKKPFFTYSLMIIVGIISTFIIKSNINSSNLSFYVNHFFTFIPVFANGMLSSWFYFSYIKNRKKRRDFNIIFTVISIVSVLLYIYLSKSIGNDNIQMWQINNRLILSFVFVIFIISTLLASSIYQKLFNNVLMKFIAIISLNLYIYHQFIAVELKKLAFSNYTLPNTTNDTTWQWKYLILCIIISLFVAFIMTYFFERPIAKKIKKNISGYD